MADESSNDQRVMEIVSVALRQPAAGRKSWLRRACQDDPTLYRQAAEAVRWEETMGSFLLHPLIEVSETFTSCQPGQIIADRFEIVRRIGEGGMGIVYECFDRKRQLPIAIKVAKPGFHRLLSPELEGALRVRHPNVCLVNEIHTTDTSEGAVDFLTMELLEGITLAEHLRAHGPLSRGEALQIASQICAGLAEAHRTGILHRDLKSANIILCSGAEGIRAVITDFGLACGVSQTGEPGGTPRYMAPELWKGQQASRASDIYAIGVILYEMTGWTAVHAVSPGEAIVPARTGFRRRWDRTIQMCLQPDPGKRPADASLIPLLLQRSVARKIAVLSALVAIGGSLALPSVRGRLQDEFFPGPSVRLAVLPLADSADGAISGPGVVQDVSDRLRHLQSGRRTVVVIPPSEILENQVRTPEQAKTMLHATHAVQISVAQQAGAIGAHEAVIDLETQTPLREFTGRYSPATIGSLPAALAGTVSLALRLHGLSSRDTLSAAATRAYDRGLYFLRRDENSFDRAIPFFEEAARTDPRSPLPLAALAEAKLMKFETTRRQSDLDGAQNALLTAESLSPDSPRVRLVAGRLNQAAGHYEQALQDYRRVQELEPHNIEALLRMASSYNALDMQAEAITAYGKAIALEPDYYATYRKFGEFYYFHSMYREAAEQFHEAIDRAPGIGDIYTELGAALSDLGKDAEAEKALLASIQMKETADARNSLGAIRAYQKRDREAIDLYRRAIVLDPDEYVYWLNLGDSCRRLSFSADAVAAYQKGRDLALAELKENPRDGYTRAFVGYFSARLGDRARAEEEIEQAMELTPGDTKVVRRAVLTYETLAERDRALAVLKGAPLTLLRELDRHPDLADFRRDIRFRQMIGTDTHGGA